MWVRSNWAYDKDLEPGSTFCLMVMLQKCKDPRKEIQMCFIDYEKAIDNVKNDELIQ